MAGNLDSLAFDLADGVACFAVGPHAGIWGQESHAATLERLLAAAPPHFGLSLLASHLLWPAATPPWAAPALESLARTLFGAPLARLEGLPWRLAPVPVLGAHGPERASLLVGLDAPDPALPLAWDPLAQDAARTVAHLAAARLGARAVILPLLPHTRLHGPSLALPAALAAWAAAHGHELPDILATGALDPQGRVLPVEDVPAKARLGGTLFLYPAGALPPDHPGALAVRHLDEAEAALRWPAPEAAARVLHLERLLAAALTRPVTLAAELAALPPALTPWLRHRQPQLTQALAASPDLPRLADGLLHLDPGLREALLACLPVETAQARPEAAWAIALAQMDAANHRGDLAGFARWREVGRRHETRVCHLDNGPAQILLRAVIAAIGERHNRYDFPHPLPLDPAAQAALEELEAVWGRRRSRLGPCACIILGQYYGTMGQHYGFLGPPFLDQCLHHLHLAKEAFCAEHTGRRDDTERDILYGLFALADAGQYDAAIREMDAMVLRRGGVDQLNPYELHGLLRIHADAGAPLPAGTLTAVIGRVERQGRPRHPWQLVALNLARLLPDPRQQRHWLERAATWCQAQGPTVQVMALLPLALLARAGAKVDAAAVARALAPVQQGLLHVPHFAPLLELAASAVLDLVASNPARFFPYTYR